MAINYGKKFEDRFKSDWLESMPNSVCIRLYDNQSGYLSISNVSDYLCYSYPNLYIVECKSHKGASIPFEKISQYDKMCEFVGTKGVRVGVIVWLYEKDEVFYVPTSTLTKMKKDKEKSVGIRHFNNDNYKIINIPSEKLRTFMKSDYSVLKELEEGD